MHSGLEESAVKEAKSVLEEDDNHSFEELELVDFQPENKVLVGERKLMKRGLMRANTTIAMRYNNPRLYRSSFNRTSAYQLCMP